MPAEILNQILGYLESVDWKTLRLTSRTLQAVATPLIFTTTYVAARRGVLRNFSALADHPFLRHCVKEIIYDYSWIDPDVAEGYKDVSQPTAGGMQPLTSPEGRQKYVNAFAEQEQIQTKELAHVLQNAFRSFSNVRRVFYVDLSRTGYIHGDRVEDLGPDFRLGGHQLPAYPEDARSSLSWLEKMQEEDASARQTRRQYGGLILLLQALTNPEAKSVIKDLIIGGGMYHCGIYSGGVPDLFLSPLVGSFRQPKPDLSRLYKLEITLQYCSGPDCPGSRRQNVLGEFLASLHNLEELRIFGPTFAPHRSMFSPKLQEPDFLLENISTVQAWSKLKVFELHWAGATAFNLLDFITCHFHGLVTVNIRNMQVYEYGSRLSFIHALRSITPKLIVEPAVCYFNLSRALIIDYVIYNGTASLSFLGSEPGEEYFSDQVSSYSHNEDFGIEERWSSEDLDYSDGLDDDSEIEEIYSRTTRTAPCTTSHANSGT